MIDRQMQVAMQVSVKLFSVLRQYWPQYDPERGVCLELPQDATVAQLLSRLNIPVEKSPVVACNGLILKHSDALPPHGEVHVFQPVAGG